MSDNGTSAHEVLTATDVAFATTDSRGKIIWANPVMAELLGLAVEQSIGRSLFALLGGVPEGPQV